MITYAINRIFFVILGYVAGVAAAAVATPAFLMLAALAIPFSDLWSWLGMGPVGLLELPVAFATLFVAIVLVTYLQAIAVNLLTEALHLHSVWLHLIAGLLVAVSGGYQSAPGWFAAMDRDKWLVTLAFLVGTIAGALIHWGIAGRNAGLLRRPRPAH
jgi:hypothetical protein